MSIDRGGDEPLAIARRVDAICCDFEAAWKRTKSGDERPQLEAYLRDIKELERSALVSELLRIDVHYRSRTGDEPQASEYLSLCPELDPGWLQMVLSSELEFEHGDSRLVPADPPMADRQLDGGPDHLSRLLRSLPLVLGLARRDEPTVPGYEILEVLGRGGMGVVYKARQIELNRVVALKMILPGSYAGAKQRQRFRREAEAVAQLQHPHIVQIHEVGEHADQPYLVLEYVDGGSLDKLLAGTPQPAGAAAQLVQTLARTVHHAHERGVLHRDLKPANILMQKDESGRMKDENKKNPNASFILHSSSYIFPKLTDFGLAKLLGDDPGGPTQSGDLLGTPCYMSPEQAAGKLETIGPATDVYGLGAILYELLTGRPPFKAATTLETLSQVRSEDPVSPSRLQPKCPRDLVTICLKCLNKELRLRYATAAELADDLGRFLDNQPIRARPAGPIERGVKWARRRPALATLLVTVPLVAALGFAGIFWQWRETVQALAATQAEQQKTLRAHEATKAHLYLNQVTLAWNELHSNHGGRAEWLLQDTDPALRHWEWHYLQRHVQTDLFKLVGHSNEIQSIAWSLDGQLLASGSGNWGSGRDGELKVWDARTGQLQRTISQEIGTVFGLAFSPNSRLLASASHDRIVRLWDPRTGKLVREMPGHNGGVSYVAFSPHGKWLASASRDQTARIWDVESGQNLHVLKGHKDNVFCLLFSSDGKLLVTGDRSGAARFWDPVTGKLLRVENGLGDLREASFSPDGAWLAFGTFQGSIFMWDMTLPDAKTVSHHPGAGPISSLCFSPDGRCLAWSSSNGSIKLRDFRASRDVHTFQGNLAAALSLAFSPDGRSLAAGGSDHIIRIWDATVAGEPKWSVSPVGNTAVCELTFETEGRLIAVGGSPNSTSIWDVTNKKTLLKLPLPTRSLTAASRSRDGRFHAWIADDNQLHMVDLHVERVICDRDVGIGPVSALAFSFDSSQFAWGGADGVVRICEAASGREISTLGPHPGRVTGLAFHPDGRQLVTVTPDATFFLWDTSTRALMAKFGRAGRDLGHPLEAEPEPAKNSMIGITRLAYSADGLRLSAANYVRPLEIWDMTTRRVAITLDWDGKSITSAGWSSDGRRLAIGRASAVRILDTAELSRETRRQAAADGTLAWHAGQARQSLTERLGFAALFHFDHLVAAEPNAAPHREGRARALAELERWPEAYAECTKAVELGDQNPQTWSDCAVLALQVGDHAAYKRICAHLIDRHDQTTDLEIANTTAWICSIMAGAIENPQRALALARRVATKNPKTYNYENTLATAFCRAGTPQEAIDQFNKAIQLHELKQGTAFDWACLCMANADLGNLEQAHTWLKKAQAAPPQVDWQDRIELRLLLAEAGERVSEANANPDER